MKNRAWKFVLGFAAVLVLSIAFFLILDGRGDDGEFKLITNEEEMKEFFVNGGSLEEYEAGMKELYAQDTYGGDTPEETLELFIEALKAGDVELASKYYILEDQGKELGEMKELSQVQVNEYISFLEIPTKNKRHNSFFDTYEIDVLYEGEYILVAKFVKNEQTNKWKIESL